MPGPSGAVTAITQDGQKKTTPDYPTPFFSRLSAAAVAAAMREQYRFTAPDQGTDDALDSDTCTNGWSPVVSLGNGETNLTVDSGFIQVTGSSDMWLPLVTARLP